MSRFPVGYNIRLGIITEVGDNFLEVEFYDRVGENPVRCPKPHPYAGRGGGILVGYEPGTLCILSNGPQERYYVVQILPDINYYFNQEGAEGSTFEESSYPSLEPGEIILKSNVGSRVDLLSSGNIAIDADTGFGSTDFEFSRFAQGIFTRTNNLYRFSEAGRSFEGIVRRNLELEENTIELSSLDLLTGELYEGFLTPIGRSPDNDIANRSTRIAGKPQVRNPPFIEKRNIVYEYASSYNVQDFETEVRAIQDQLTNDNFANQISNLNRNQRRTDTLNLNLLNYNHLIETVQGTMVDIYGNVLDINRNVIPIPGTDTIDTRKDSPNDLANIYDHIRRSIKYHFEVNSRKPIRASEPALTDLSDNYGRNFSKFSLDIDGEGLTKINIPASSETGNIPVLSRYFNNREEGSGADPKSGSFRPESLQDIRIGQFGSQEGQQIANNSYTPKKIDEQEGTVTVGTAFHNILNVANSIFENGRITGNSAGSDAPPVSESIDNSIGGEPNAGGRSLHANLDGSIEASIGADTVDRKSLTIDCAGGIISQIGRDKNGRSLIQQFDGDVIIQIGSQSSVPDRRFGDDGQESRPGRLEIHLDRGEGNSPQKLIIDERGLTLKVEGNTVFDTSGDMTISAGARLLLQGELVFMYGSHDSDEVSGERRITGSERLVLRNGNVVI